MKIQYQRYRKMQFYIQLRIDIWEIVPYLQANPYVIVIVRSRVQYGKYFPSFSYFATYFTSF